MPVGKGSRKFLVVVVDYFTKWAEAEELANYNYNKYHKFPLEVDGFVGSGSLMLLSQTMVSSLTVNHFESGVQNFVSETIIARYFIQRRTGN
jgi:hypothetical protein